MNQSPSHAASAIADTPLRSDMNAPGPGYHVRCVVSGVVASAHFTCGTRGAGGHVRERRARIFAIRRDDDLPLLNAAHRVDVVQVPNKLSWNKRNVIQRWNASLRH